MSIDTDNISCIILAGGRGKRFDNMDKGMVQLEARPLIEHSINRIQNQVDDIVISANRNIDFYSRYSDKVITDTLSDYRGPLSGIASAMPHCRHEWILVVACDMPFLPADLVDKLSAAPAGTTISVASTNNSLQLALLVHRSLLNDIEKSLDSDQLKLMQWIQAQKYHVVEFSGNRGDFDNINCREDIISPG